MRRIIDENGRLFGAISILDVAVLLLVAMLAVAAIVKQDVLSTSGTVNGTTVTYTVYCQYMENGLVEGLVVGDPVYDHDQDTGGTIGTILSVEAVPATLATALPDGSLALATSPYFSDVTVTIQGDCAIVDGHYRFNGIYELGVNANRNFYTPFMGFTGYVSDIG